MTRRRPCRLPFQRIDDRTMLCLICARVVAARARAAHEKGIEHKSAVEEMARRAS